MFLREMMTSLINYIDKTSMKRLLLYSLGLLLLFILLIDIAGAYSHLAWKIFMHGWEKGG